MMILFVPWEVGEKQKHRGVRIAERNIEAPKEGGLTNTENHGASLTSRKRGNGSLEKAT